MVKQPTESQKKWIEDMEKCLGVKFKGKTLLEAGNFIEKHKKEFFAKKHKKSKGKVTPEQLDKATTILGILREGDVLEYWQDLDKTNYAEVQGFIDWYWEEAREQEILGEVYGHGQE